MVVDFAVDSVTAGLPSRAVEHASGSLCAAACKRLGAGSISGTVSQGFLTDEESELMYILRLRPRAG